MSTQPPRLERNSRVFNSVFGGTINSSQPTPVATPASQFTVPGQAFGAPVPKDHGEFSQITSNSRGLNPRKPVSLDMDNHVEDQVQFDRAWHLVTQVLSIPDFPQKRGILEPLHPGREFLGQDFYDALEAVLYPQTYLPLARQTDDIVIWYTSHVRQHLLNQVLPMVLQIRDKAVPADLLSQAAKLLETAYRLYFDGLSYIKAQLDQSVSFMS